MGWDGWMDRWVGHGWTDGMDGLDEMDGWDERMDEIGRTQIGLRVEFVDGWNGMDG